MGQPDECGKRIHRFRAQNPAQNGERYRVRDQSQRHCAPAAFTVLRRVKPSAYAILLFWGKIHNAPYVWNLTGEYAALPIVEKYPLNFLSKGKE
ncbi:MAG: hypothetical protein WCA63_04980 [Gallionella sp.]|jgi:hypothetical protein